MLEKLAWPLSDPDAGFQLCTRDGVGLKALVLFLHKIVTECKFQRIEILRIVEPTTSSSGSRKPLKKFSFYLHAKKFVRFSVLIIFALNFESFLDVKRARAENEGKAAIASTINFIFM